ncbi:MAG TPA: nucleotidyltransferase family protein [Phycisphaerae bacterium]|nr:nucleotidyltransferase family protein [Phycisphaerae bacterium]
MNRPEQEAEERLRKVIIPPGLTISLAVPILDRAGLGILLLCDDDRKLLGVVTDGDIRRALLHNISFNKPCSAIATRKPLTAWPDVSPSEAMHLMDQGRSFVINHLPLIDGDGRAVGLLLRRDLVSESELRLSAVIMAGGFGKRLFPLTQDVPKPMLPIGDRPLMQRTIEQLRDAGISRVNVTTHYRHDKIAEHFGDGREFGVRMKYVNEDQPLGTAGALALMEVPDEPLLVINGDILTQVDFRAMLAYHRKHEADLTVGLRNFDFQVPYGVLECEGPLVRCVREKPRFSFLANGGIYLLEPSVYPYLPSGERCDMTDLIQRLLDADRRVVGFPITEYWLDIGRPDEYAKAQKDVTEGALAK